MTSTPPTFAPTMTGMPIAPYAPAATLATRQIMAAFTGRNPSCTRSAAQMAIGTPNPAAPSRNAPKAKAMSSTWMRWSGDMPADRRLDDLEVPARTARR